jgi:tetratricopeptide (TPR) repeat protein
MKALLSAIVIPLLFVMMASFVSQAQQNGWEESFFMANKAYKEGRFEDAVKGYEGLIATGHGNGHIYYNLGNAYFRLEQIGKAVLNYERARIRIPRDADLNFNLDYARDQVQDVVPEDKGFLSAAFFWAHSLTMDELFLGFAGLNILFWAVLIVRLFTKSDWTYYTITVVLILWLIGGSAFGWKYYRLETDDRAVIVTKEADILAGPDKGDTVLFKLHEGTIVSYERSEDGWSLVSLPDEKRGWVTSGAVEKIMNAALSG